MKKIILITLVLTFSLLLSACKPAPYDDGRPDIPSGQVPGTEDPEFCNASDYYYDYDNLDYDLVWSDEFDGDTLDLTKWRYEVNGYGGGNEELQYYTDENTSVTDGVLSITAKLEAYMGMDYTSSRITTEYREDWTYGIFEIKAKLPSGLGTWPAIWMMPTYARYGTWPDSGELDIMEHVGYNPNIIYGTVHTERYNHNEGNEKGGDYTEAVDVTSEFHVYKVEWLPDKINFYVDGVNYFTYDPNTYAGCPTDIHWPFNGDFFLILNVAIGGSWGGVYGVDNDIFPTTMEVDYVRVYQSDEITNIVQGEE